MEQRLSLRTGIKQAFAGLAQTWARPRGSRRAAAATPGGRPKAAHLSQTYRELLGQGAKQRELNVGHLLKRAFSWDREAGRRFEQLCRAGCGRDEPGDRLYGIAVLAGGEWAKSNLFFLPGVWRAASRWTRGHMRSVPFRDPHFGPRECRYNAD